VEVNYRMVSFRRNDLDARRRVIVPSSVDDLFSFSLGWLDPDINSELTVTVKDYNIIFYFDPCEATIR
jgi:hypothetical protein